MFFLNINGPTEEFLYQYRGLAVLCWCAVKTGQYRVVSVKFLPRVSTPLLTRDLLTRDIDIGIILPSVRLSVSHAPVLNLNGLTRHRTFFSTWQIALVSPLVFPAVNTFAKFPQSHPLRGVEYRWLYKFRDFQPISGCMWKTIQDRGPHHGTAICKV